MIPKQYEHIKHSTCPRILREAVKMYGIRELSGEANNPVIIGWAKEIGKWIGEWYNKDSIPWCGLFVAVCAHRAGYPFDQKALSAKEWARWGVRAPTPMLGDVLVFGRTGGGHVGLYVGEDSEAFHVLGGNQNNEVNISRIARNRLLSVRRSPFAFGTPLSVKRFHIRTSGGLSDNEE